ncbi:MAG: sugar-binding domain-containing protein, partial [Cyclobacteriaceae bacterium]
MKKYTILIVCLLLVATHQLFAGQSKTNFNKGWEYLEYPAGGTIEANAKDTWEEVELPHSWNSHDATDMIPGYRRTVGWYRKIWNAGKEADHRYFMEFEGSNLVTSLYVNGELIGTHTGGYIGFKFEITDALKNGQNQLMVRVDNSINREIIPSQKSDFFIYGGITRDVWMEKVPETYIEDINISTPSVSSRNAETIIEVDLDGRARKGNKLLIAVLNPDGKEVYSVKKETKELSSVFKFNLRKPQLWDVRSPQLYTIRVQLLSESKVLHSKSDKYGYRW